MQLHHRPLDPGVVAKIWQNANATGNLAPPEQGEPVQLKNDDKHLKNVTSCKLSKYSRHLGTYATAET